MKITVVHPRELGEPELARWRDLRRGVPSLASPFLSPEFTVAVGGVREQARVAVLTDGPAVAGFFPFERRGLGYGVPVAAGLNDGQGVVHAPGLDWDPRQLLRACGLAVWEFDNLVDGQKPLEPYQTLRCPSPIMDLTDGFPEFLARLGHSARFTRDIARKRRKLEREIGPLRLEFDSRDPDALRTLMAWKSDQYRRTGIPDRFARPWIVRLVEQLLDTRSESLTGLLSMLYAGDVPIAAHVSLRSYDMLASWFPAYDRRFKGCSPGLVRHLCLAEAAAGVGVGHIDMGRGTEEYKDLFRSRDLFVFAGRVTRLSAGAAYHLTCRLPVRRLRDAADRRLGLYRRADEARRRYALMRAGRGPVS